MSTVTSSPSVNDFMYGPQASFETSVFADENNDPGFMDRLYADSMPEYEPTYETEALGAATDQAEAYANDPSNHAETQANESRAAIRTLTAAENQQRLLERRARIDYSASIGRNLQTVRDQMTANREFATPALFTFLRPKEQREAAKVARMSERQLIQAESEIGRTVFGPVANGARREFFCFNEDTWIWHEEWTGDNGKHELRTTRYEIRGDDVIKSQDGELRSYVSDGELTNLVTAERLYYQRVMPSVYHRDPNTGRPLIDPAH